MIQDPSIQSKKRTSVLPLSWQILIKRKIHQCKGLLWILAGGFVYSSQISQTSTDPTWNRVFLGNNEDMVKNWMGFYGATLADFLSQFFGSASWLIGLPFIIWGFLFIQFRYVSSRIALSAQLLLSIVLFAGGLQLLSPQSSITGQFFFALVKLLPLKVQGYEILLGILLSAIGTIIYINSLGLSTRDWAYVGSILQKITTIILKNLINLTATLVTKNKKLSSIAPKLDSVSKSQRFAPHFESSKAQEPSHPITQLEQTPVFFDANTHAVSTIPQEVLPQQDYASALTNTFIQSDFDFSLPSSELLSESPKEKILTYTKTELEEQSLLLKKVLDDFGIRGDIVSVRPGPVVTLYELVPAPGIKSSRIISLADDIARSMSAISARVSVVPGRNAIGIELPNEKRQTVYLKDLLQDQRYNQNASRLPLILGKDISGAPVIADLGRMPHLLVAGTTGSGKSVGINAMILSLVFKLPPQTCKFIMIDPKMLELSIYDGIPHLLTPVVTDPRKAVVALKWAVREMENRYRSMSQLSVRNIDGYNEKLIEARNRGETLTRTVQVGFDNTTGRPQYEEQDLPSEPLPYIVVIVDEMADLMLVAGKDVEGAIQRLAQMARAAGIHLIMATQRPSVDVITGTIKANFPTRISFQVTSKIDSRTILGEGGAEQLLGQGDMLYMAGGGRMIRVHGPFVKDQDVESVVKYLRTQGSPQYISTVVDESEFGNLEATSEEISGDDELFQQAVDLVQRERKASTSFIQRYLKIGYNRAASIMDEMERRGLVSEANHVGKREVLIPGREAS